MNKQDLITISKRLREKKDVVKQQVKTGTLPNVDNDTKVIIPKCLFETSIDLQSDQWYFNGFIIQFGKKLMVVDPGVDFYSRFTATGLSPLDIQAIVVTHGHSDHTASMDLFIEKVLRNKTKTIDIFISDDAFHNKISPYHQQKLQSVEHVNLTLLKDDQIESSYSVFGNCKIEFCSLFHSIQDTFGFKMSIGNTKIGYVSDTGYAIQVRTDKGVYPSEATEGEFENIQDKHDHIKKFFSDVKTAVVNLNDLQHNRHSKYHLSGWDVIDLFDQTKIKTLVLHHLSLVNIEGEDSNYLYKLFFDGQSYETILPHYLGRIVPIC